MQILMRKPPSLGAPAAGLQRHVSLYDDFAEHALFIVAWNEAGKFEFPAFSEFPNELPVAVWQHAPRVRIGMLHVCVIFHDFCMLAIVQDRREDKLVILLALVL
jgi:hypothetical protein